MKRRSLSILFALLLTVSFILPQFTSSVSASAKIPDGKYSLPITVLQGDKDEPSKTNDYIESPGKLIVENGSYQVQMTIKNSDWWQYFKVNGKDVTVVSEDKANKTRVVTFPVQDVTQIVPAKIHIIVPDIDYDNHYDIRLKFDTSNLPIDSEKSNNEGTSNEDKADGSAEAAGENGGADKGKEENPPTGDQTPMIFLLVLMLGSAFFLIRRTVLN